MPSLAGECRCPARSCVTAAADDRFWIQGFVRSRQQSPVSRSWIPTAGVVGEVDLESLDLSDFASTRPTDPGRRASETPDETLDRLPGAVRRGAHAFRLADRRPHRGAHRDLAGWTRGSGSSTSRSSRRASTCSSPSRWADEPGKDLRLRLRSRRRWSSAEHGHGPRDRAHGGPRHRDHELGCSATRATASSG